MRDDRDLERLEHQIGRLLMVGVWISALALFAGLVMWFAGMPHADRVLACGLILLMAIPVARIATSLVDAIRRHDRLLAWSTATVLTVLAILLAAVDHLKR
jgi:uncharacterized membrane protein